MNFIGVFKCFDQLRPMFLHTRVAHEDVAGPRFFRERNEKAVDGTEPNQADSLSMLLPRDRGCGIGAHSLLFLSIYGRGRISSSPRYAPGNRDGGLSTMSGFAGRLGYGPKPPAFQLHSRIAQANGDGEIDVSGELGGSVQDARLSSHQKRPYLPAAERRKDFADRVRGHRFLPRPGRSPKAAGIRRNAPGDSEATTPPCRDLPAPAPTDRRAPCGASLA